MKVLGVNFFLNTVFCYYRICGFTQFFECPLTFLIKRGLRKAFQWDFLPKKIKQYLEFPSCNIGNLSDMSPCQIWPLKIKRYVKRYQRIPTEIYLKMGHSRTVFQGQSRSREPTWIDRLAMENGDFGRTSQIFAPDVFNAPRGWGVIPWNFVTALGLEKN